MTAARFARPLPINCLYGVTPKKVMKPELVFRVYQTDHAQVHAESAVVRRHGPDRRCFDLNQILVVPGTLTVTRDGGFQHEETRPVQLPGAGANAVDARLHLRG